MGRLRRFKAEIAGDLSTFGTSPTNQGGHAGRLQKIATFVFMRTTMAERLARRREHKPNPVLYAILYIVVIIMKTKLRAKFIFKAKPSKDKGPFVLVSNHACRNDYIFTAPAVWPRRLNYVVGYNEFFRFPTALLLKIAQVIPKRNFVTDVHAMRSMMRIIDKGGHIMFMPEGMNSITGMSQPVMPGTGKLLKKLGVNVYYTLISGGYLSYTKHCLDERPGRTEVVVDKMFSPEELAVLTPEQIGRAHVELQSLL